MSIYHVIPSSDAEILRLMRVSDLRLPPVPYVLLLSTPCDVLRQDLVSGPQDNNEQKSRQNMLQVPDVATSIVLS